MLKVAIIGCGKIADQHASNVSNIPGCRIVGVCDREILMAKQLYERFDIDNYYDDINVLLNDAQPDVVHITTPPQSHLEVGKLCLESGIHVYMEKPFALNVSEAELLITLAKKKGLYITVGHNLQFSHATQKMRKLIKEGFLGGNPIHMESYYCYNIENKSYAKALLGDKNHWVRSLPGKLMHNLISHGISKIAEFINTDNPKVITLCFQSNLLKSIDEPDIIDELRVIIYDNNQTTAHFTFSTQMKPTYRHFRIYGPKNGLELDEDNQIIIKINGKRYKSYLEQFIPPFTYAHQYLKSGFNNIHKFLKNDFRTDHGMKYLIEAFYAAIIDNQPVPIPYREILTTTKLMEDIFNQVQTP